MKNIIGVNTNSYHGFSLDEALEGIAAAGFKYVELTAVRGWTEHVLSDMSDEQLDAVKEKCKKLDLTPFALSGHCNLMSEERLKDFEDNIELASKLGCEYIVSSTGEAHFGENESFADDVLVENVKRVLQKCEECDVKLALEVHGEYGTGESLKNIVDRVHSDLVGVNYDTANVVFYGRKLPEEEIKTCVNQVNFVHLKDKAGAMDEWNFPAVGKGDLKLEAFMKYMDENGYEGPYSIEIEYTQDFTMNDKKPGDLAVANQAVKDSYDYLKSMGAPV